MRGLWRLPAISLIALHGIHPLLRVILSEHRVELARRGGVEGSRGCVLRYADAGNFGQNFFPRVLRAIADRCVAEKGVLGETMGEIP